MGPKAGPEGHAQADLDRCGGFLRYSIPTAAGFALFVTLGKLFIEDS
jgi:hypothetical protein